ncbi:MAG TPA: phosphoenolpyruvate--protein phosphotransferase [Gammaproteobacteria bacterium]|nr:phosphoenolpyruvate--protein phosphotransferase [Gammaproteobacteria bacterium]
MFSISGVSASKGIAIGRVHIVDRGQFEVSEGSIKPERVKNEIARFHRALRSARGQLKAIKDRIPRDTATDVSTFIDTHLLMLEDSALTNAPVKFIREKHCNAEWALKVQRDALVAVFEAMDDPYLRTRKDDIDHVVNRIQRILLKRNKPTRGPQAQPLSDRIVFADDLTPADTVLMQHQGILAFLTEFGGPNSHTAILARSLRIPAVVGLHSARAYLRDDELVIIDGQRGVVIVDPDPTTIRHFERRRREIDRQVIARKRLRRSPAVTSDGEAIELQANVELPSDMAAAAQVGAAGIGLYRTEYLYMNREEPPDEEEQYRAYLAMVNALKGAPVTIRTLDLGADKQVDGSRPGAPVSSNPALGLRAVRLCLKEQGLFRPQLRAILRVSARNSVRLMVPMLSNMQELVQVLQLIKECQRELKAEGKAFDPHMPVGAMIEVPAAAVCADLFARRLDFLSIGTNDLIQYTIAIDRIDDEVSYLYDPLHPAVLRLIQTTINAGKKAGIPVAMCGEMAGDARYTRLLLGLGLKEFSVHPNALLEVKQAINETHIGETRKLAQRVMRAVRSATRDSLIEELNHLGDA